MFSGASNINGGLAIGLLKLNQVTVSADQTQPQLGQETDGTMSIVLWSQKDL
jgi:hypothetical protein